MITCLDTLSSLQCRQRFSSYQRFSWIGAALGVTAAIGLVVWKLVLKEPVEIIVLETALVGVAVWTVGRACASLRYGSYWQVGAVLVGSGLGLATAVLVPLPVLPSTYAGLSLAGNLSALTLLRFWYLSQKYLVAIAVVLFGQRLTSYVLPYLRSCTRLVSLYVIPCAFRQAVCSGDIAAIFSTAGLTVAFHDVLPTEELPTFLEPVITLAKEEHAILQYAKFSADCSLGHAYCGDYQRGIALTRESYDACIAERDKEIAATRGNAEGAPLRHPFVVLLSPTTTHLQEQIVRLANDLMAVHQEMGAYSEAIVWGHKASAEAEAMAKILEELPLPPSKLWDKDPTVGVHLNLADLMLDMGLDPEEASPHITKAKKLLQWSRDLHKNEQGLLCLVETKFLLRSGRECKDLVRDNLRKAAGFYFGEGNPKFGAELLLWLGVIEARNQDLAACKDILEQGNTIDDRCLQAVFPVCSDDTKVAFVASIRRRTDAYLSLVRGHFKHDSTACLNAFALCMRRKELSAAVQAARTTNILSGRYPKLAPLLEEHTALSRQIAMLATGGAVADGPRRIALLNERRRQIESKLSRSIPEMRIAALTESADRQAISSMLGSGGVLIEFIRMRPFNFEAVYPEPQWDRDYYVAFILPAGEPDNLQMIDLGETDPIDQMIATFRSAITDEDEDRGKRGLGALPSKPVGERSVSDGIALRAALFDPFLPAIGNRKQLLLAPDGDLTRLPFEVLPTGDGGRLIDHYQISYLSTGRDVLRFGCASSTHPAEPLVTADPDFDLSGEQAQTQKVSEAAGAVLRERVSRDLDRRKLHFDRLPGTRVEGERIAEMLGVKPSRGLWLQGEALEARLKACRSPRILHLATHGFFLSDQQRDPNKELRDLSVVGWQAGGGFGRMSGLGMENPLLRSGLALAGANTFLKHGTLPPEAEDGILTAEDVSGLDLLGTELVVLSACETGLGEVRTGEGVFGLRRAFVLAGAKTLVMSLWKVPDEQTRELMEDFYHRIQAGQPRAEALREAQLAMKHKYPDPFYWGAFICQGDPSPLPAQL